MGNKEIIGRDIDYFKQYPEPIMELMQKEHFTIVNSTISYYGPMLYYIARAMGAEQVLEIGHAEGYTGFYLAHAIKDNGQRFGMKNNMYYGIDIVQTEKVRECFKEANLPATIINMDSMTLPGRFKDMKFDIIFQDGCHDTEHVLYELEAMYPLLKPNGLWIAHDTAGPAEEAWHKIMEMIIPKDVCVEDFYTERNRDGKLHKAKYKFEYIRLLGIYGISIMRKLEGVDLQKRYWTD